MTLANDGADVVLQDLTQLCLLNSVTFAQRISGGNNEKLGQYGPGQKHHFQPMGATPGHRGKAPAKASGKVASHQEQIERCSSVEFVNKNACAYI